MSFTHWVLTCLLALAHFFAGLLYSVAFAKSGDLPLDKRIVCEAKVPVIQAQAEETAAVPMWVRPEGMQWELLMPRVNSVYRLLRNQD